MLRNNCCRSLSVPIELVATGLRAQPELMIVGVDGDLLLSTFVSTPSLALLTPPIGSWVRMIVGASGAGDMLPFLSGMPALRKAGLVVTLVMANKNYNDRLVHGRAIAIVQSCIHM